MGYDIEPTVGIRGLPLGSRKAKVRQFFKSEPRVFQRTPSANPADHWPDAGVFAYYNGDSELKALEFASPAEAKLHGRALTAMSMEQAAAFLRSLDPDLSVSEGGASLLSSQLGVGIWCSMPGEPEAHVESVLVFSDSYFD